MTVLFCYLLKSDFFSVRYCTKLDKSFLQGNRNKQPCLRAICIGELSVGYPNVHIYLLLGGSVPVYCLWVILMYIYTYC